MWMLTPMLSLVPFELVVLVESLLTTYQKFCGSAKKMQHGLSTSPHNLSTMTLEQPCHEMLARAIGQFGIGI